MINKNLVILFTLLWLTLCATVAVGQIKARIKQGTASCPPNLDYEFGNFINWETNTGKVTTDVTRQVNILTQDLSPWSAGAGLASRHELMNRQALPAVDKYGGFPVNPPNGGGQYALKLGSDENDPTSPDPLPNALSESVRYKIDVPNTGDEYSILFSFAVVLENPNHPDNLHTFGEQPRFTAIMYEEGGDTLPCVNFTFVASDPVLPFDTSGVYKIDSSNNQFPGAINFAIVKYLPWTQVFVNLKAYKGKTVYLDFTTTDCTKRGHFGYAYVDVIECNYKINIDTRCNQQTTSFTGPNGPFQTYEWYNEDYSIRYGSGKNLVVSQALADNAKINLVLTPYSNFGCLDTLKGVVKVIPPPTVDLGADKSVCFRQSVQLGVPPAPGLKYQWSPAINLSSANTSLVNATPIATTTYTLTVTDTVTGCTVSDNIVVNVDTAVKTMVNSGKICVGDSIFLNASGASDYVWSPSAGLNKTTGATVIARPSVTTTYTVTGSSTQSACRATDTARVEVNPNPVASLTVPAHDSCADSKLILKGEGGGLYSWFYNNQVISGATSSSLAINQNGLYVLRVSTDKGCWDTASTNISLTFLTKPKADFIAPWGCKLKQISFVNTSDVAQSGSVRWKWEFGDGNTSDQKEPTYIYRDNNIYSVKLTVMPLSCPQNEDVVTKLVRISDGGGSGRRYPTVNTFKNTPTELSARPGATKYLWDPSVGLSNPRIQKPIFNDDQQNEYLIKIVTQEGCDLVDTLLVLLFEKEDVLVPDAFSPNGDGVNDYLDIFTVGIREIKFWVFNRWGQIMFETSDPAQRWDGTYMGKKQPLENYVWIAEAITNSGRKIRKRGQSILIR